MVSYTFLALVKMKLYYLFQHLNERSPHLHTPFETFAGDRPYYAAVSELKNLGNMESIPNPPLESEPQCDNDTIEEEQDNVLASCEQGVEAEYEDESQEEGSDDFNVSFEACSDSSIEAEPDWESREQEQENLSASFEGCLQPTREGEAEQNLPVSGCTSLASSVCSEIFPPQSDQNLPPSVCASLASSVCSQIFPPQSYQQQFEEDLCQDEIPSPG